MTVRTMNARELDSIARHQAMRIGRLREALAIVSAHPRPDGQFNRDRAACRELAARALEQDEAEARYFTTDDCGVNEAIAAVRADLERARHWVSKSIPSEAE